jgi:uncharacterized protein (TIGR03435 family)
MRAIENVALAALVSVATLGQAQPAPRTAFEVASVKPSGPPPQVPRIDGRLQGGPGTADPERITDSRVTLQRLIREAYGVDFDQIQGPPWIAEEKYDITAKVPTGATKDQLKIMLQSLLEERFKLNIHHLTKPFPVYELTIAKGGSKLKENAESLEPFRPGASGLASDRDGFPQLPPGKSGSATDVVNGINRMTTRGMPISFLIFSLGSQLGAITGPNTFASGRIVDKTGLTGKYDFRLEYAGSNGIGGALSLPSAPDGGEPTGGLPIIDALEKELGLKLTKSTAVYDVLVIDHAEKVPTPD